MLSRELDRIIEWSCIGQNSNSFSGSYRLLAPDGSVIGPAEVMTYLGAAIYADGRIKSELNRRLGAAWAEFFKLSRLWKHTSLGRARKIQI